MHEQLKEKKSFGSYKAPIYAPSFLAYYLYYPNECQFPYSHCSMLASAFCKTCGWRTWSGSSTAPSCRLTMEKWAKHCIFSVPLHLRKVRIRGDAFRPQTVALGPFHHDDRALRPMEEHKLRAVAHLLRRAGRTLGEVAAAVEEVAEELEDAYAGLDDKWRGRNRGKFLETMVADGCFLLEVMRNDPRGKEAPAGETSLQHDKDYPYAPRDPIFSPHALKHIAAFIQRDMLMIENQLPLILLKKIVTAESGEAPSDPWINALVLKFLCVDEDCVAEAGPALGLHPLDLYRRSLLRQSTRRAQEVSNQDNHITLCCLPTTTTAARRRETRLIQFLPGIVGRENEQVTCCNREKKKKPRAAPRSAQKLLEAGIRFKRSDTGFLDDVSFNSGSRRLRMPRVMLDDSTEHKYRNAMAFEALYKVPGAGGNDVTAYVMFLKDLVDSAVDVELLREKGVLAHELAGSDWAVVRLLNRLTQDVAKINKSRLCDVHRDVENYCDHSLRVFIFRSWAKLKTTYLSSPWAFIGLVVGIFLLGTDIIQTSYAVMSYELEKRKAS